MKLIICFICLGRTGQGSQGKVRDLKTGQGSQGKVRDFDHVLTSVRESWKIDLFIEHPKCLSLTAFI